MRRIRAIGVVIALFGLAGTAWAQYYPAPQYYYNPYNPYPPTYYASSGYGYYPGQAAPVPAAVPAARSQGPAAAPITYGPLLPAEDETSPVPNSVLPPVPATKPVVAPSTEKKVRQAQVSTQEPPASVPQAQDPVDDFPVADPVPLRAPGLRPVRYTIPEVLGSFPFTPPTTPGSLYFKTEYLLWRMRDGPPHFPLVTTDSNPGSLNAGAVNSPTARPLFGTDGFQYGTFNGMRATLGFWIDPDHRFGIEGSGFLNEKRSVHFGVSSDDTGNPALYLPAFNVLTGREQGLIISDPTIPLNGTVDIAAALQLWGAELNGIYTLARTERWNVETLLGFRYLDLLESIDLQNQTSGFGLSAYLTDHFQTRNQFYGAQLGIRGNWTYNRWSAGLSGKIALGANHQISEIRGGNVLIGTPAMLGGFLTQPSNIGRNSFTAFSAVPQFGANIGFNVTQRCTIFAGYDFLLWTYVARAGDQIDRVLNLSQSAQFGQGQLSNVIGRPEAVFHHSDFWAQGISFGLQYRY
ncbi:MAG TPA: BBP7 family outer membrane beta-barrel protein [Gemmataceae bacterium]|nr:BBP7 family outer membrane beta-barrel protein [Gemmataceae bacterium]